MRLLLPVFVLTLSLVVGCGDRSPTAPDRDDREEFIEDLEDLSSDGLVALHDLLNYEAKKDLEDLSVSEESELERKLLININRGLTSQEVNRIRLMVDLVAPRYLDWAIQELGKLLKERGLDGELSRSGELSRNDQNDFTSDLRSLSGDGVVALVNLLNYKIKEDNRTSPQELDEERRNLLIHEDRNLVNSEINRIEAMVDLVNPRYLDWAVDEVGKHLNSRGLDGESSSSPSSSIRNDFEDDLQDLTSDGLVALVQFLWYKTKEYDRVSEANLRHTELVLFVRVNDNLRSSEVSLIETMVDLVNPRYLGWAVRTAGGRLKSRGL